MTNWDCMMPSLLDDYEQARADMLSTLAGPFGKPPVLWIARAMFDAMSLSILDFYEGVGFVIVDGDATLGPLRTTRLSFSEAVALKRSQAPATG